MQKLQILNTRDVKDIIKKLKEQFGYEEKLDYVVLQNNKGKIYLISRDLVNIETQNLRVDTLGLYFGKQEADGIRLSIEGSQIIGPKATKNIIELEDEDRDLWVKGYDMDMAGELGFVIIKNKDDFLGCGKLKNNKLYNYVPKSRRLMVINA
ncbi:MAG: hypothetical protein ABIE94_00270 [archaeon]